MTKLSVREALPVTTEVIGIDDLPAGLSGQEWHAASVSLMPGRAGRHYLSASWETEIVLATGEGGGVLGFLPVQRVKSRAVPSAVFDPAVLAPRLFCEVGDARAYLFVGGCADLVAGAVTSAGLTAGRAESVRRALVGRARAEAEHRGLVAAAVYVRDNELAAFLPDGDPAFAPDGVAALAPDGDLAVFAPDGGDPRRERIGHLSTLAVPPDDERFLAALTAGRRRTVLKDRRAAAEAGLRCEVTPARDAVAPGADLVAAVKRRHGIEEHPRLLRTRLAQWAAEPVGERVAFAVYAATTPDCLAVTFGCAIGGRLEIYETGVADDTPHRHEAYVESLIHAPLRYALDHRLTGIDLGIDAETPKTRRGATLSPVWAVRLT
ncbi:hypothetical protein FXF51_07745 [Nonomuraea sp. PA05]|uniref:GNAT family N-acetyltransferase n=1 Tax=Nonomuraea sp. PA05 TaxID=2604466 RepID=UPI0011D42811|nr:GNAT family N-acetyltransferase [Nonomuraea sp. PA05]TYB69129.1 hypothetical protein FXF51_07745 [Nonomuraea sp. PA05]